MNDDKLKNGEKLQNDDKLNFDTFGSDEFEKEHLNNIGDDEDV